MAVRFDPTVNLGHMLTFAGFIATTVIGWQSMDKRVTVLETKEQLQSRIVQELKLDINTLLQEIRSDVKEIRNEQYAKRK